MKKIMSTVLLTAIMLLGCAGSALGAAELDGVIEPARTLTLLAPYSGTVEDHSVRVGDAAAAGEALFAISAKEIVADTDGVVRGMFAMEGDSAAVVQERYGALCSIERDVRYNAVCSTSDATGDHENKIIHPGETVHLRSMSNNKREGMGRVTIVDGSSYTVEVIIHEDMRPNEQVKIYRDENYEYDSCIGAGKLALIAPVPVTAEGYVLGVHAAEGQRVRRGDRLFTIVPDALDGMKGGAIALPQDGVILSVLCEGGARVEKDAPLATWCPAGEMELVLAADEDDLPGIDEGMAVKVMPDALDGMVIDGVVRSVARAADQDGSYAVVVALEAHEDVRIGMSATALFE